jgi:hypothetical protein
MESPLLWRVYQGAQALIASRQLVQVGQRYKGDDKSELHVVEEGDKLQLALFKDPNKIPEFIIIDARDGPGKERGEHGKERKPWRTIVVVTGEQSNFDVEKERFNRLLNQIDGDILKTVKSGVTQRHYHLDIIIAKNTRELKIKTPGAMKTAMKPMSEYGAIFIELVPYCRLLVNPIEHCFGSPARLLTREEGEKEVRDRLASKSNLRQMKRDDPLVFWLGGSAGQIILEYMYNENCGTRSEIYVIQPN